MGRVGHQSRYFIFCVFLRFLQISLLNFVSSQYIQIQTLPQIVDLGEDTLTIVCSLSNPSQVKSLYLIQLQRNTPVSFEKVVSITLNFDNFQGEINYQDLALQGRTTATGTLKTPSTAELRLTFTKENVRCPEDFKEYRCKMSAVDSNSNTIPEQEAESNPVQISYRVQPNRIEMPKVRILAQQFDTNERQFEVGTALQLTCTGQIGSDPTATIRWCAKTGSAQTFKGLPQTPLHSQSLPSGCQYTRSSTITYNLTNSDTYTQFLCESGHSGLCGTGTARQYVNITLGSPGLQQSESNACSTELPALIPVLGSTSTILFLLCCGLVMFILVLKHDIKNGMCCFQRSENKEYAMHDVTRVDEHHYQDLDANQ